MKFTKKPVTIEAIQVLDFNPAHATIKTAEAQTPWFAEALSKHGSEAGAIHFVGDMLGINTLEGTHWVTRGDFIIRGVKGELYPCKPDIFALTYEAERTTSPVSQMTDATIREIFMAHGFTIKEGQTDLKPYVYAAARALLAAAAPHAQAPAAPVADPVPSYAAQLSTGLNDPFSRQPQPVAEQRVNDIVTALYRRFKDWSKRGFGPDDVTWCEVKADVMGLIAANQQAPDDRRIADTVNTARDIAIKFHDHQSLRERLAAVLVPVLRASQLAAEPVAWVPVHPVNGPLWANTVENLESDRPANYPVRALFFKHPPFEVGAHLAIQQPQDDLLREAAEHLRLHAEEYSHPGQHGLIARIEAALAKKGGAQ